MAIYWPTRTAVFYVVGSLKPMGQHREHQSVFEAISKGREKSKSLKVLYRPYRELPQEITRIIPKSQPYGMLLI